MEVQLKVKSVGDREVARSQADEDARKEIKAKDSAAIQLFSIVVVASGYLRLWQVYAKFGNALQHCLHFHYTSVSELLGGRLCSKCKLNGYVQPTTDFAPLRRQILLEFVDSSVESMDQQ
eukprot:2665974-Amphidinium_carterae.1